MVATIVFTQNNIVPSSLNNGNNQLAYNFPNSISFPNHEIAIQNISIYYSWVNINASTLQNNTFYYLWNVGSVSTPFPVVLPDGLYEITTINKYLQFIMISRGHYAKDNTNSVNVYFAEFIVNTQSYGVQINCFPIPSAFLVSASTTFTYLGVSYTTPSNWTNPGTIFTPTITMCNPVGLAYSNFYKVVGFPALWSSFNTNGGSPYTYTVNSSTVATSQNSTTAPAVQPNPTLFFAISNIDNKYSNPSTIVYQMNANVAFGELITITPPQFAFNKLLPGTYNGLRLSILGTNFQPISILDPAMTITMVIRDRKDISLTDALGSASGGK
jgi:hypothetical protein